jgi:MerR family copper efflux transcriptional regulator
MSTYQIADVAERSGFTPATLRYYEDIGLMAPAGRTDAGYRLYDDGSLERLRFIARAKQLGCTLEEITDLATAWDGGECGPLQDRLRAAVEAKVSEAHARIAELTAFTADLQRAAATLAAHRPDGPCDDDCGCTTDTPTTTAAAMGAGTSVPLIAKPDTKTDSGAGHPPIACTLGAGEMSTRLDAWNAVLEERDPARGVVARRPLPDGVRLEFGPDTDVTELARLAAAEQGCCRFFSFALVIDTRGVALEVHAPPDAADVVAALFGTAR